MVTPLTHKSSFWYKRKQPPPPHSLDIKNCPDVYGPKGQQSS